MQSAGSDSMLGGGNILIEGHKSSNLYEWQKATCYGKLIKFREKTNGIWSDWETYVTNSDLVSYLGVPDYKNAVTLSDNIQTYTAPSNGYIKSNMYRYDTTITYWIIVSINNKSVWIFNGDASKLIGTMFLPVAKGDIIKWNYEDTSCGTNSNLFIPCK